MDIYTVEQVRELERVAKEELSISERTLMQCAGAAALGCLSEHFGSPKRIAIVCGTGNNGGDGYVLGRLAYARGIDVRVWQVGNADHLKDEALEAAQACYDAGVPVDDFAGFDDANTDVIVDAIFGTGLDRPVEGEALHAIERMNASAASILSLDVPSGLNADTGRVLGDAVCADATVTFLGLKPGLFTYDGIDYAGKVYFDSLQVPAMIFDHIPAQIRRVNYQEVKTWFMPRDKNTHKGNYGHVLIVGGNKGYSGAVQLAALAALRSGAGLVSVATHPAHAATLNVSHPEMMCHGIESANDLTALIEKADVIVLGPGLGQDDWAKQCFNEAVQANKPKVIDADALNLLAQQPMSFDKTSVVLTPHPGEASRLLNQSGEDVQRDRFQAIRVLQDKYHATCILKGAGTLIADHDAQLHLCTDGNPGMASGGMGDLLSGIIAGLVAQQFDFDMAVNAAVAVHAHAGDNVAKETGERGVIATDLLPEIHRLVNPA
ncbi:MAG: NAD(P)H-hydrate dehydratase [Gammaproteobacteria bacterium]